MGAATSDEIVGAGLDATPVNHLSEAGPEFKIGILAEKEVILCREK
jgi:hypothetical protein